MLAIFQLKLPEAFGELDPAIATLVAVIFPRFNDLAVPWPPVYVCSLYQLTHARSGQLGQRLMHTPDPIDEVTVVPAIALKAPATIVPVTTSVGDLIVTISNDKDALSTDLPMDGKPVSAVTLTSTH